MGEEIEYNELSIPSEAYGENDSPPSKGKFPKYGIEVFYSQDKGCWVIRHVKGDEEKMLILSSFILRKNTFFNLNAKKREDFIENVKEGKPVFTTDEYNYFVEGDANGNQLFREKLDGTGREEIK